ncbi:MAG: sulfate/molybdate ABC transporter ATP-binding protein [Peptostreptococcaceae bacterium]
MSLVVNIKKNLNRFNLDVAFKHSKGVLGFLGQSGSGKSMTLKCIAGLETPSKGIIKINDRILYDSENNINLSPQNRKVGYLFQNYALFPHMTVLENIEVGLNRLSKFEKRNIAMEYIKKFKLVGLEKLYPWQISGGQAQRVALARVLVTEPEVLLLDEPFSALDYNLKKNMEIELKELLKDYKGDVIFVTHDVEELYRVCDDVIIYNEGNTNTKRTIEELFYKPKSRLESIITGCKNISRCKKIDSNKLLSLDWGYEYIVEPCSEEANYMGIRKEDIILSKNKDDSNSGQFIVKSIISNPFTNTIYVSSVMNEDNLIELEISKENLELEIESKVTITFPKEKIFYFK